MDKMKKWMIGWLCVCMLLGSMTTGRAWVAEEFYDSRADLPAAVNKILETMLEPGEEMVSAHRGGKTAFLLSEDKAGMRRVFIFQDSGRGYELNVVSPKLAAIEGVKPGIGSGGELYLMYNSNYCFSYVGGKWLLTYVQFVDDYMISPHYLHLELLKDTKDYQKYLPAIGRYTGERDLGKITAADLPVRYADALNKLDRTGYAVVNNPNPRDRLYLRKNPSQRADSLGKFYNGAILQVKEKKGDWWRVSIGHLDGWMMGKYLAQGTAMDQVKPAFPTLSLKDGKENALRFTTPEGRDDKVLGQEWPLEWRLKIIGVYGDEWFILMTREGQLYYQKQAWFWEGNG